MQFHESGTKVIRNNSQVTKASADNPTLQVMKNVAGGKSILRAVRVG
jgi:hypothetical protein